MAKYGNWNARQPTEGERKLRHDEKVGAVIGVARTMFQVLIDSDLTESKRRTAVAILTVLANSLGEK